MRERNDDKHDYRERQQDPAFGGRRIWIRNLQFFYQTVETLHAALDGDAAHLRFAISAMRCILCRGHPDHSTTVQAALFSYPTSGYLNDGRAA